MSRKMPKETYGYNEKDYSKFKKYGWIAVLFYTVFYMVFYMLRLNLNNASPLMIEQIEFFDESKYGVLTAVLLWCYAAGILHGGLIAEHIGVKKTLAISGFSSFLLCIAFGFCKSYPMMLVIWGLNGVAQGLNWPAGVLLLNNWWPKKQRGFASGIATAGTGFGQGLVSVVVALSFQLAPQLGWQAAFWIPAIFPLLAILLLLIFVKEKPENVGLAQYIDSSSGAEKDEAKMKEELKKLGKLGAPAVLLKKVEMDITLITSFFMTIVRYGLLTWAPLYFISKFEIEITTGLFATLALPIGMAIGAFAAPAITDRMKNRYAIIPPLSFVTAIFVVVFVFLDPRNPIQFVLIEGLLFLAGFTMYAVVALQNTITSDIGGRVLGGTATSLTGLAGYLGAGLQAVIYGNIINQIGWDMVFYSMGGLSVLCGIGYLFISKKE